jgi:hypothetical protein
MRSFIICRRLFTKYKDDCIKEDKIGRECSTHGEMKNEYNILVGSPEGKRPLLRPRLIRQDNIKIDLKETG